MERLEDQLGFFRRIPKAQQINQWRYEAPVFGLRYGTERLNAARLVCRRKKVLQQRRCIIWVLVPGSSHAPHQDARAPGQCDSNQDGGHNHDAEKNPRKAQSFYRVALWFFDHVATSLRSIDRSNRDHNLAMESSFIWKASHFKRRSRTADILSESTSPAWL